MSYKGHFQQVFYFNTESEYIDGIVYHAEYEEETNQLRYTLGIFNEKTQYWEDKNFVLDDFVK